MLVIKCACFRKYKEQYIHNVFLYQIEKSVSMSRFYHKVITSWAFVLCRRIRISRISFKRTDKNVLFYQNKKKFWLENALWLSFVFLSKWNSSQKIFYDFFESFKLTLALKYEYFHFLHSIFNIEHNKANKWLKKNSKSMENFYTIPSNVYWIHEQHFNRDKCNIRFSLYINFLQLPNIVIFLPHSF